MGVMDLVSCLSPTANCYNMLLLYDIRVWHVMILDGHQNDCLHRPRVVYILGG